MHHGRPFIAPGVLLLALALASPVQAQQQTGRVDGVITDSTAAVVPGATVLLTGPAIAQLETTTGTNGDYHFLNLAPGTYVVTAKLPGFADVVRENVIVSTGASTQIDLQMRPSGVTETVTVTGASPVVDVRRTTNEVTFDQTQLQEIPTARDPWSLLQQTPGVLVDRVNVGGNESGQQSTFIRGASNGNDTMWNLDGIMITDPSAIGSTPTYYDFDAFQEVQFTTGGNDIKQQTGGIGINFVTKRGSNQFRGSGRFFGTTKDLQSHNVSSDIVAAQPTFGHPCSNDSSVRCGNEIDRVLDFGAEVGGPLVRDKAWFWGSAAKNDIKNITIAGNPDNTQLIDYNAKVDWQANNMHRFNFLYFRGDKQKQGRNASPTRPPETTWNQTGPTNLYKVEDNITIGDRTFVAARYAFIKGGFTLDPQGGRDANVFLDTDSQTYHGSFEFFDTTRPQHQFQIDGNHFVANHEVKFGFQYRHTVVTSFTSWPGNKTIADLGDGLAFITRDALYAEKEQIVSGYAGDSITWNRVTLSLNVRWDRQWGNNLANSVGANPIFPDLLPALNFPGRGTDFTWNDFSPRVGVTIALDEAHKTVARANYGRYAAQIYTGLIAFNNALGPGPSELDYAWADRNGDKVVQRGEVDVSPSGLAGFYYVDPDNPGSITPPNRVDPNLKAPISQDFLFGIDREVMPNFAVGAAFTFGTATGQIWEPLLNAGGSLVTQADFVANATPASGTVVCPFPSVSGACGQSYSVPWYRLRPGVLLAPGHAQLLTNRPGYEQRYTGLQFTANKRLADRWMLKASFGWNNPIRHLTDPSVAIQDPTSTQGDLGYFLFIGPTEQDAPYAIGSGGGSGAKGDVFINSTWQFNVAGLYQFPMGIDVAANLLGRQGYPNVYYHRIANPDAFTTFIRIKPFDVDEFRNPNVITLDGRVQKEIGLPNGAKFIVLAEGFNLLNKADILQLNERVNQATANQVREILSPRIIRFGARFTF
jgi:hypothetical protein